MADIKTTFNSPPDLASTDVEPGSGFIAWCAAKHYISAVKTNILDNLIGVHKGRILKLGFRKSFTVKERNSNKTPIENAAIFSLPFTTPGMRRLVEFSRYSAPSVASYVLKTVRPLTTSNLSDEFGRYFAESADAQIPGAPIKMYSRAEQAAVISACLRTGTLGGSFGVCTSYIWTIILNNLRNILMAKSGDFEQLNPIGFALF